MYQEMIVIGKLKAAPTKSTTPKGFEVASFEIYSSKRFKKDELTWFKISVFGKQSGPCLQFLDKGSSVFIKGTLTAHPYITREHKAAVSLEIAAADVIFLSTPKIGNSVETPAAPYSKPPLDQFFADQMVTPIPESFSSGIDYTDEELPF